MDGESDSDKEPGTFGATSFWGKTKILFGGVIFNWIAAMIILSIISLFGLPKIIPNQFTIPSDTTISHATIKVTKIEPNSPAEKAGFREGDEIIKLGNEDIVSTTDVLSYNNTNNGQKVSYTIRRDGHDQILEPTLNSFDSGKSLLGVHMEESGRTTYRSTWSAPIVGIATTIQLTGETFRGLGEMCHNLFSGITKQFSSNQKDREYGQKALNSVSQSVSGPIGIIGVIFPAFTAMGFIELGMLTAIISISLACMNVLPIPALDGGRWLLIAIYRLRKKNLNKRARN